MLIRINSDEWVNTEQVTRVNRIIGEGETYYTFELTGGDNTSSDPKGRFNVDIERAIEHLTRI